MPKKRYTKKDRERVYKVALDMLREKHHKEYVALRSKFTQEERNLVGEVMNGPVTKYHSYEATEAYNRVIKTTHAFFSPAKEIEVVIQKEPFIKKLSSPNTIRYNPRVEEITKNIIMLPANITSSGKPVTVTIKDIKKSIKKIKKWNTYKKTLETVAFIERDRDFWLADQFFKFTREEIDNADTTSGYIGTKAGIRCYIRKPYLQIQIK